MQTVKVVTRVGGCSLDTVGLNMSRDVVIFFTSTPRIVGQPPNQCAPGSLSLEISRCNVKLTAHLYLVLNSLCMCMYTLMLLYTFSWHSAWAQA